MSGHVWACIVAKWSNIAFRRDDGLRWYHHTTRARRGFCKDCGSTLFWQREGDDSIDISAGALDAPTGLRLGAPAFPQFKGDYYAADWLK